MNTRHWTAFPNDFFDVAREGGISRHQLTQALKPVFGRVCVKRRDPSRMAGIPCGEQVERDSVADFTEMDSRSVEPQALLEAFLRVHLIRCVEKDYIEGGTLDFPCVFDDDMALIRKLAHHFGNEGVGEGRFP